MTDAPIPTATLERAVELACRAPSLHNSQPWRWTAEEQVLHLMADPSRIGRHTDSTGREVIISCGAVLDHLRVALAAAGWQALIDRYPDRSTGDRNRNHLARIEFQRAAQVTDDQRDRARAIARRRTDRLPFAAPLRWSQLEAVLRDVVADTAVGFDVISDSGRPALALASRLSEQTRRNDSSYHAELGWWTGGSGSTDDGIPASALASESEAVRVDVGRVFPTSEHSRRRAGIDRDHSMVLVLSTYDDSPGNMLRCGEVLSALLLECTVLGLATCTLSHMIEVHSSREAVRRLTGHVAEPQLLIRVGRALPGRHDPAPEATPRRALTEVLEVAAPTQPPDR
jgi:nitroreductase